MSEASTTTSQVRWLVVGPLGTEPTGKTFTLHRGDFMEWLEGRALTCSVTIPDGIGSEGERTYSLAVEKLRSLSIKEVVKNVPELQKLLSIAGDVRDPEQAIEAVSGVIGEGLLTEAIAELGGLETKPKADDPESKKVDSIFEQAEAPSSKSVASAAVDAFLKSTPKTSRKVKKTKSSRQIRDAIEAAVYAEARAVLEAPEVQALEAPLRGLWMLASQCPKTSGIVVEVLDVPVEEAIDIIRDREAGDLVDEPDAIFIPTPIDDVQLLGDFASLGEEMLCPVIIDVAPSVLGKGDLPTLAEEIETLEPKDMEAGWLALRQEEASRWLCGVINGVALVAEGVGVAKRVLIGSGVWAFAAILSKSYTETGSFARIAGRPGSLGAPAVRTLEGGRHDGMAAPTEIFVPIRGQARFAKHGLLALGSSRNSDVVVLANAPMARASADAVPFPAQLLTGRIVRFSRWVRDQLPPGSDADTARAIFKEAAKVFLFPGMSDVGEVDATIKEEEEGERVFSIYANISPLHAGIPFELAFPLPLE